MTNLLTNVYTTYSNRQRPGTQHTDNNKTVIKTFTKLERGGIKMAAKKKAKKKKK